MTRRTAICPGEDVLLRWLPPSTVAARSPVDAAQWAWDDVEVTAVVAAAFQQRLVPGGEVLGRFAEIPGPWSASCGPPCSRRAGVPGDLGHLCRF